MGVTRAPRARGRAARTAPTLETARKGCTSAPFLRREGTWVSGALRRGSPTSDPNGRQRDRRQSRGYYRGNSLVTVRRDFIASSVVASITNRLGLHLMDAFSIDSLSLIEPAFHTRFSPQIPSLHSGGNEPFTSVTEPAFTPPSPPRSHGGSLHRSHEGALQPFLLLLPASCSRSRSIPLSVSLERSAGCL